MNPKSVAIIVVVAIVVAGVSYGTYLMDSDEKLELRDYLVEGDWAEYYYENLDQTERFTVQSVISINNYEISVSGQDTVRAPYGYVLNVVDTEGLECLRSERVDTFLGEIECDVYDMGFSGTEALLFVEPDTGLVLIEEGSDSEGNAYKRVLTGTSVFDDADSALVEIALAQPVVGSAFTHLDEYYYISGDLFQYEGTDISVTVDSVNDDGALNLVGQETPVTVEEFMSGLMMTDEEISGSTLIETKVFSTQWGVMECDVYSMQYLDAEGKDLGERQFIVESDTGLVLMTWVEMHDVEYEGVVWEQYVSEFTLTECSLVLVAD